MRLDFIVGTAVVAFASTNIDDIFVLLAFMGDRRLHPWQVVAGQYIGIGLITLGSAFAATRLSGLPPKEVHLLGILPIVLGLWRLWLLRKGDKTIKRPSHLGAVLTVAIVTISNGADNVAVYIPLFTKLGNSALTVFPIVFAILTGMWCLAARWLLSHPPISSLIDRWGHRTVPLILILLGIYILFGS